MHEPDRVVPALKEIVDADGSLAELLERSVRLARARAEGTLNPDLFDALEWPADLAGYYRYLENFIRWIPQQTDSPAWASSTPERRYAKEVSDRLAHFFWLIDQKSDEGDPVAAESSDRFGDWLTQFAREWGAFLDTPASFSQKILDSFPDDAPEYRVKESLIEGRPNQPSGWLTFNQFFARSLNAGLRPITEPASNLVVTSPADCIF